MRILVGGYIGLYSIGGATWDYIQYPLGLHLLGHEVYYIEDTMQYPVYQPKKDKWDDCSDCVAHLKNAMEQVGLKDRWAYRDVVTGQVFGMGEQKLKDICATADVFINVSASTFMREEYNAIPIKMLVDTDPMFTQYQYYQLQQKGGKEAKEAEEYMKSYNLLFTFGLNINSPDSRIPTFGFQWHPTKKPTVLNQWASVSNTRPKWGFTSILNWIERPPFEYDNEMWGQKNVIFERFLSLPVNSGQAFDLIINTPDTEEANRSMQRIVNRNWHVLDPYQWIPDKDSYREFIQSSFGEFSITKETYIKSNSGWFSGRSACYLAAGKPVITQDTQWSKYIPSGQGLFACNNLEAAANAVKEIMADYAKHSRYAQKIAAEYFDSSKVLSEMLAHI
ncbi:MAG: hypothetical protein M3142_00135 [Bacteroidota bacterium]|nr:hypothetical protein [Bacteroidota bacterium]